MARRAATPELHGQYPTEVVNVGAAQVFAVARRAPWGTVLCLFNVAETWTGVPADWARAQGVARMRDVLSGGGVGADGWIALPPYARVWIV